MMTSGNLGTLDTRALERFLDGDLAQLVGRKARKSAVEGANRRPGSANDNHVVRHMNTPCPWACLFDSSSNPEMSI